MPVQMALVTPPMWAGAALVALAVTAAILDLWTSRIPNWLTLGTVAAALLCHALTGGLAGGDGRLGLRGALAGLLIGFLPMGLFWLAGAIGGGDAKLMGAIGALGGWRFALAVLVYGIIVAAFMAAIVMIQKRVVWRTLKRVWQALGLLLMKGRPADPTGPDSPTVPFAVALCFGVIAALLEALTGAGLTKLYMGG